MIHHDRVKYFFTKNNMAKNQGIQSNKKGKREYIEYFTDISFRGFEMWCRNHELKPYEPESLKLWLTKRKNVQWND